MSADPLTPMEMYAAQDARDAKLLALGLRDDLLAHYLDQIRGRCEARIWHADAEDVAQEVVFRLWKELKLGRTYPVPYRVVVAKVTVWTIKGYFVQKGEQPDLLGEIEPVDPGGDGGIDGFVDQEFLVWMASRMPTGDAEAFRLRYIDELEPAEIAERQHKNPNAIHQALSRCHNLHIPRIIPEWKPDA